jgi:hypothetical protein
MVIRLIHIYAFNIDVFFYMFKCPKINIMKRSYIILLLTLLIVFGCKRDEENNPQPAEPNEELLATATIGFSYYPDVRTTLF